MTILSFLRDNAPWLAAGVLLTLLSSFGQTYFISLFAGEIREAFQISHGEWGAIYAVGTTVSAIAMIWAGALTDRFRVRVLGAAVLVLLAVSCLFMAINPVWWLLPFVIFCLRFTGQGMASLTAVVAMSRWFIATRGKALSVANLGFAIGQALLPIIFVGLLAIYDWRLLWVGAAGIALCGVPLLFVLLRSERTPQSMAKSNQSLGMRSMHWTRNQTVRHPLYWFMVPALLGPGAFNTAFFFHQVHFAEIKQMTHVELVAMLPFYTVISIAAMVVAGWALDKIGTARLIVWYQLPMVAAFVTFAYAQTYGAMLLGFFFLALTTGGNSTLPNAFWAEFFGTRHLGAIKAMAAAVMVLGSAIGPGVTGLGIDLGVGIETQYLFVAAYFVFATVMMAVGVAKYRSELI
ncbi:MFS transporter [Pelagimonas varians]|uniref:Major Facilitator Superfamily protein n=1 Tax=Pelagimonas varians TaxID=696760 RepID=A0A238KS94_9RHOB|nr:MFS transporter [Pelagimonas varians]PYG32499.1 putative MFS family arabinose efflux permease [Pelagimonas varians]SMX45703.1 Major Facilitator Superfamily protein [Pelagimonas varians]